MSEGAFRRVILKLSGESLMGSLDYGTDPERLAAVARQIARRYADAGDDVVSAWDFASR